MKIINKNKNKGFVILMASLLSGLFLIIGASIFQISIKELILSSGSKDSQYAFYAADSGIECALYWDIEIGGVFATSSESVSRTDPVYCNYQNIINNSSWSETSNVTSAQTTFSFDLFPEEDAVRKDCVIVSVFKESNPLNKTIIESRGYNNCESGNRRFERGLRISYDNY